VAYYKVQIEVWCDWDPELSSLDEIVENTHTGDAVYPTETSERG